MGCGGEYLQINRERWAQGSGGDSDHTAFCLGFGFLNEDGDRAGSCCGAVIVGRLLRRCGHDKNGGKISPPRAGRCDGSELAGGVSTMGAAVSPPPLLLPSCRNMGPVRTSSGHIRMSVGKGEVGHDVN
jgi:hypothetical protein